jgi:acetoacetyl-CoA synthetase
VNLDLHGGGFFMPLFVKLRPGLVIDESLRDKIRARMRNTYSARHVPDKIVQVDGIPYTLTGKKLEVPIRRLLMGVKAETAVNRAAISNPDSLRFFELYAETQTDYSLQPP